MKTLRALPVVLIGAVVLGSVGCSNPVFSESLVDDFEITETSTEESIGTFTTESEIITGNNDSSRRDLTAETNAVNVENGSKNATPAPNGAPAYYANEDDHSDNGSSSSSTSTENGISSPSPSPIPTNSPKPTNTPVPTESPSNSGSSSPTTPTNTPVPTATPTPKPTNTPVPTATPTSEPTATPEPTPRPAVAAYVQATFIVYGATDDDNPTYVESTVVRTYKVQPKDGCSYHSPHVSNYVCIDAQISWSDLDNAFLKEHPGCVVHGYDTVDEQVIGFVDD